MNKKYNLKLDLQFRCNNSIMKFNQFDNNTSDFFIRITNGGKLFDVEKAIVVLAVIKPSGKVASQFVEVKNGLVYADLKPNMKDEIGTYTAQAMLILEDERVVTDVISYEVEEDKIFSLLNDTVETTEEFTLLTDMLSRLSTIEISEEQRVINEAERILSEENRKIEEAKRVEAELIRQHEEADRAKYDATRESNENIRKQNESIRLANETNRIDEEAKRVEEENKRKLAEEERNANYNFMTEDEERRRLEANAHKEAENLRVQAETNRVNEEAKRRTTEQARVSAENTRVNNENTREASEVTRQNNENQRVEAETQRKNRYNSFIADAEANASNFENYTNTAKVKEEERKSNELDRKTQEARRVSNEVERISNENTRKANEVAREKNETSRQYVFENKVNEVDKKIVELNATKDNFVSSVNTKVDNKISELDNAKSDMTTTVSNKIDEVETRFNALTSSQQQDAEVIDARDGETSLKARLDRDIEKAKQVYIELEGNHISTESSTGAIQDLEIKGNTVQDPDNLADIKSVGELQEDGTYKMSILSCGKNLFDGELEQGTYSYDSSIKTSIDGEVRNVNPIYVKGGSTICFTSNTSVGILVWEYNSLGVCELESPSEVNMNVGFKLRENTKYINFRLGTNDENVVLQLEEGTQATPYEPYQENKCDILLPCQLEKVGDVADRLIEKDGVWGVEKNIKSRLLGNENWYYDSSLKRFQVKLDDVQSLAFGKLISNAYIYANDGREDKNMMTHLSNIYIIEHSCTTSDEFNKHLRDNNVFIKYATNAPQFIPLPRNTQIQLNSFFGTTHVYMESGEVEGTIKCKIPKSLGATVQSLNNKTDILSDRIEAIEGLKDSQNMKYETDKGYLVCKETKNGVIDDLKIEGKTLVNLFNNSTVKFQEEQNRLQCTNDENRWLYKKGVYTIVNLCDKTVTPNIYTTNPKTWIKALNVPGNSSITINLEENQSICEVVWFYSFGWTSSDLDKVRNGLVILEGDHTQNPPSYFEGLMSVGQDVDKIEVSSVDNIQTLSDYVVGFIADATGILNSGNTDFMSYNTFIKVDANTSYWFKYEVEKVYCYREDKSYIGVIGTSSVFLNSFTTPLDCAYVKYRYNKTLGNVPKLNYIVGGKYQSDKKQILFYNENGELEPIQELHEWDSIEKHSDNKWYYHKRSGKRSYQAEDENNSSYITDMTNTVYQLAEEEVYELAPLHLDSYANETLILCNSGAISPKMEFSITSHINEL
ncbi:MAG TPA: hypothetical protein K8V90_01085, partial [Romboutsia timonensis]|nr:hypothetical protein [Romboutsia timonensis]